MPHITRDGINIYYEDHGSGPAILLGHGFSSTSKMWADQVNALKDEYRVIVWDMRGHGDSDSPDDPAQYSEAHTVEDMAALLNECGIDSAVIGGLSLGGYMSLAFHLKYPEKVDALMLFDTGPGYKNDQARDGWNKTANEWAADFDTRGLDALEGHGGGEMRKTWHKNASGLAHAARGMLTQRNDRVIQSLPGIEKPALALVGADDKPFIAATDYMAAKISGAEKVVIPDAGHAANMDQPEAFNEAVRSFLSAL